MPGTNMTRSVSLIGEVMEMFVKEGKQVAKVAVRPVHIEVCLDGLGAAHLGDTVRGGTAISLLGIETTAGAEEAGNVSFELELPPLPALGPPRTDEERLRFYCAG